MIVYVDAGVAKTICTSMQICRTDRRAGLICDEANAEKQTLEASIAA